MSLALFALERYFVVLIFCAAACLIGAACLRSLTFANLAEGIAICTCFGLGLLSHLILLAGVLHGLTITVLVVGIGLVAVVSALALRRESTRPSIVSTMGASFKRKWILVLLVVFVPCLILYPAFFLPLYPPTDPDVTMFHLAVCKEWLNAHAVIATPFLRGPVLPHSAHTLFAALMLLRDDLAAQTLSLAAIALIAIALFGWAKRVSSAPAGFLAAALWLGSPATLIMSGIASYHILSSLFAAAFVYSLANFATTRHLSWLFAAAAFCGFAQSTWSMTAYFLPVAAIAFAYFLIRERSLAVFCSIGLGLLVGWGPALARALYYTGNPFFPLLTEIFGPGPWWTRQDVMSMMHNIRSYGLSRNVIHFLRLPFALAVTPTKFQGTVSYSIALSVLVPIVLLRSFFDKYVRGLTAIILFYFLCWFMLGQIMRYLLPIVPIACLAAALTGSWLIQRLAQRRPEAGRLLIAIVAVALLLQSAYFLHKTVHKLGAIPQTPGQRTAYLTARLSDYPDIAAANLDPGPLYSLFGATYAYFSDGFFMGDWFGPGRYAQIIDSLGSGEELYHALHHLGARYFFVTWRNNTALLPYDEFFDQHFETVRADLNSELYRIHDTPTVRVTHKRNLLRNPNFDDTDGRWPEMWVHAGSPKIGNPSQGVASGGTAVQVNSSNYLSQTVRVEPGGTYQLRLQAFAGQSLSAPFRLQVNWLDRKESICGVFIRVCQARGSWQTFAGQLVAPANAQKAIIYANGQTAASVWLDSFLFQRMSTNSGSSKPPVKANP